MKKITDEEIYEIAADASTECSYKSKTLMRNIIFDAIKKALSINDSEKWIKIEDSEVRHIWKKTIDCCDDVSEDVVVNPDWYQDNGTPICKCGNDLEYSHTEIFIKK